MSIQQYRCKKHPNYTRRRSVPDGTYFDEFFHKTRIKYKTINPVCPICRELMTPWYKEVKK